MESIKILFSFSFKADHEGPLHLKVFPTDETDTFFSSHSIRFIQRGNKYEAVWFSKNNKDIERIFFSLFRDVVFTFDVLFEKGEVFNIFDLEVGKVYLLSNDKKSFLHKGDFLSSDDCATPPEYMHHLLAKISIDMNRILSHPTENEYTIVLKRK